MLLGRKLISPSEVKRFVVDYSDWLQSGETLSVMAYTVGSGPATVSSNSISGDGKSAIFFIQGAVLATTPFNLGIQAITSLTQVKQDHLEFDVVAA